MREIYSRRTFLKAAGLSTVGMTVFGLTGCGSDGGGSGENGGNSGGTGNGGSSGGDENTGNGGDSGNGGGSGNEEVKPGKADSRTIKYFTRQGVMGDNKYVRYYAQKTQWEIMEACDGRRRALHGCIVSGYDKIPDAKIMDYKTQTFYEYNKGNTAQVEVVAIKTNYYVDKATVQSLNFIPSDLKLLQPMMADPMTVDGVEYYCEKRSNAAGLYDFYCFAKEDLEGTNLKYVVRATSSGVVSEIYEVREVASKFDQKLLQIPEGCLIIKDGVHEAGGEKTGVDAYPND